MNPNRPRFTRLASRATRVSAAFAALLLCGAAQAGAGEWKWSVAPYVWATDVGVDVSLEDRQVVDAELAFNDLLEDLETVAQVHVEAQRGAHGLMLDLFDVQLADDGDRVALPGGSGAQAVLDSEIGMTIFEAGGIYDPRGDQQGFALLYGTRVLSQRAEIDARLELGPGTTVSQSHEVDETLVDGMVGVRYVKRLSPRWTYLVRGDLSAGGTELTWTAGSMVAYAFGNQGRYSLAAGYRHMVVDFDTEDTVDVDMTLSGFLVGLRVAF